MIGKKVWKGKVSWLFSKLVMLFSRPVGGGPIGWLVRQLVG